jgi:hypothetical protein
MRGFKECPLPPYYLTEVKTYATRSNRQYWLAGVLLKHSNLSEEFLFFWNIRLFSETISSETISSER